MDSCSVFVDFVPIEALHLTFCLPFGPKSCFKPSRTDKLQRQSNQKQTFVRIA